MCYHQLRIYILIMGVREKPLFAHCDRSRNLTDCTNKVHVVFRALSCVLWHKCTCPGCPVGVGGDCQGEGSAEHVYSWESRSQISELRPWLPLQGCAGSLSRARASQPHTGPAYESSTLLALPWFSTLQQGPRCSALGPL